VTIPPLTPTLVITSSRQPEMRFPGDRPSAAVPGRFGMQDATLIGGPDFSFILTRFDSPGKSERGLVVKARAP
jgi:hypothetical protein